MNEDLIRLDNIASSMSILREVDAYAAKVSDSMIRRSGSKMDPCDDKDRLIGTVQSLESRRLHCALNVMKMEIARFGTELHGDISDAQEAMIMDTVNRIKVLYDFTRALFWSQVQVEMGIWDDDLGLRHDWMLVVKKKNGGSSGLAEFIMKTLGSE